MCGFGKAQLQVSFLSLDEVSYPPTRINLVIPNYNIEFLFLQHFYYTYCTINLYFFQYLNIFLIILASSLRVICYLAVRIRQMTQYAATAVADIDPDSARLLLGYFL